MPEEGAIFSKIRDFKETVILVLNFKDARIWEGTWMVEFVEHAILDPWVMRSSPTLSVEII